MGVGMLLTCPHCGKADSTLGHILGHAKSEAKTATCRANAKRPRPRKPRSHHKKKPKRVRPAAVNVS